MNQDTYSIYQWGLDWSQGATVLSLLLNRGTSLSSDDRRLLLAAANSCRVVQGELDGETLLGRVVQRVANPLYRRDALVDLLKRAETYLVRLVESEPTLESVTLSHSQTAWLVEFLSDLCTLLLREIATKNLLTPAG